MIRFPTLTGAWAIRPEWLSMHIHQWLSARGEPAAVVARDDRTPFALRGGTAVIPIIGPITKEESFWSFLFGGTSAVKTRESVIAASGHQDVSSILLHIDSPGGHVAGIQELSDAVYEARSRVHIHAHIDDLGASAAYWVASQAHEVSANATAEVGSIGTLAVVHDLSQMAENEGIKVHVISTGKFKGAGVPGSEITDEHLAYFQERVDAINGFFLDSVARGRGLSRAQVDRVADGRVFSAASAQDLGLIDRVQTFDDALAALTARSRQVAARARALTSYNRRRVISDYHRKIAGRTGVY